MTIRTRKPIILVVDDEPDAVSTYSDLLDPEGYDACAPASLTQALRIVASRFIDLLLLDERLGPASGTKLLEECRQKHPELAGIVVTGHADVHLAAAAMRAGALDLLLKPVSGKALLRTVSRALSESE